MNEKSRKHENMQNRNDNVKTTVAEKNNYK